MNYSSCQIVAAVGLLICAATTHAVEVVFPDANLEAAIRDTIGKPNGPIDDTDLVGVGFQLLDASGRGITDLTGIEFATDLNFIGLSNNNITDLSPLQSLTGLLILQISNNNISDLSPLGGLPALERLIAGQNSITDFSTFMGSTAMEFLTLGQNPLASIATVSTLPNLQTFSASGSAIMDLTAFSGLMNLTNLTLTNSNVSNLSPLTSIPDLRFLDVSDSQVADLSPLSTMTTLETLSVRNNPLSGLTTLPVLPALQSLDVGSIGLVDLGPVSSLTTLTQLNIDNNSVISLAPISMLTNLTGLLAMLNQITDLDPLMNLMQLQNLFVGQNQISDLTPVAGLTNLVQFSAPDNSVTSITAMAGLTDLFSLDLNGNQIEDIAPLVANPGLDDGDQLFLFDNPLSQTAVCTDIPILEVRGMLVIHNSICIGPPPNVIDCPVLPTIDLQGHQGYDFVGLDWVKDDANMDGVRDRWQVGLIARVMCAPGHRLHDQARAAFLTNLFILRSEPNPMPIALPSLLDVEEMLAALLATSADGRDYVKAALGLQGDYVVVTEGAKTPTEPFSGSGDLDGDGTTNVVEFDNVIAMGGSLGDFLFAALSTATNGSQPIPAHTRSGLAACVGLLMAIGLWFRRTRRSQT